MKKHCTLVVALLSGLVPAVSRADADHGPTLAVANGKTEWDAPSVSGHTVCVAVSPDGPVHAGAHLWLKGYADAERKTSVNLTTTPAELTVAAAPKGKPQCFSVGELPAFVGFMVTEGTTTMPLGAPLAAAAKPPETPAETDPAAASSKPKAAEGVITDDEKLARAQALKSAAQKASEVATTIDRSAFTGVAEVTLYFLPDGTPAHPIPVDLTERDMIHLKLLLPTKDGNNFKLNVSACPDKDPTRTQGTYQDLTKVGALQADEALPISVVDVGDLSCGAGAVAFKITTPYSAKDADPVSLKLLPVYFGTFGAQFTFDFTQDGSLSAPANAKGANVIVRSDDVLGPKVVPVFVLHPFGQSFEHPSIFGVLVNPTLGLDLDHLTTSFFVGDSVCAIGLCLAAGVHVRQVDSLVGASGLHVGDTFDPATGTLPTEKRWSTSDGGTGAYVGLTLDINTAVKLIGSK